MPDIIVSSGHDYTDSSANSFVSDADLYVHNVGITVSAADVDVKMYESGYANSVTVTATGAADQHDTQYMVDQGYSAVDIKSGVAGNILTFEDGYSNTVKDSGGSAAYRDITTLTDESQDSVSLYGSYERVNLDDSLAAITTSASGDGIYMEFFSTVQLSGKGGNYVSMYDESNTLIDNSTAGNFIYVESGTARITTEQRDGDSIRVDAYATLYLYGKGGNTVTAYDSFERDWIYDSSTASNTIVLDGYLSKDWVTTYAVNGDKIDVGERSRLYLYGEGGNIVTFDDRAINYMVDDSSAPNTVNVMYSAVEFFYAVGDKISLGGDSEASLFEGGGNTFSVTDASVLTLGSDTGVNSVNVDGGFGIINADSGAAVTFNIADGAARVYTSDISLDNTLNLGGGAYLDLISYGNNTINVSGTGNLLNEHSSGSNHIFVGSDAGLSIEGPDSDNDRVYVSGTGSTVDTLNDDSANIYLDGAGTTIEGTGYNTIHVRGTGNSITEDSSNFNEIDVTGTGSALTIAGNASKDAVNVDGTGDTIKASDTQIYLYNSGSAGTVVMGNGNTIIVESNYVDGLPDDITADNGDITVYSPFGPSVNATVTGTGNRLAVEVVSTITATSEYIALDFGAYGTMISGNDNTLAVNYEATIYGGAGEITVNDMYSDPKSALYGTGNSIAVDSDSRVHTVAAYSIGINYSARVYLYGAGGDTVNVTGVGARVYDHSSASDTINVSSGGYDRVYTYTGGDTINVSGRSTLELFRNGGNTVFVLGAGNYLSGTDNYVYETSTFGSTINVTAGSGLYLYGDEAILDTVVVKGTGTSIYANDDTVELSGNAGTTLYGDGGNTIVVSGSGNTFKDDSDGLNTIDVSGAGLTLTGNTGETVMITGSGSAIAASGDFFNVSGATSGNAVTGNDNTIIDEAGFTFSQSGDVLTVDDGGAIATFTGTGNAVESGAVSTIDLNDEYISLGLGSAGSTVRGNGDTVAIDYSAYIYTSTTGSYVYSGYSSDRTGTSTGIYGSGDAIGIETRSDAYTSTATSFNIGGDATGLVFFGAGGDTVNLSGVNDWAEDLFSGAPSTFNIDSGHGEGLYLYTQGDTIKIGGVEDSFAKLHGNGGDTTDFESKGIYTWEYDYSDGAANVVNVGNGSEAWVYTPSNHSDTFNVSGGSELSLDGFGGNTVFVSGAGNAVYEEYYSVGNTINVGSGAGLYLYGNYDYRDTVVVTGTGSTISAVGDYIEFNGVDAGSTLVGADDTVVVTGTGNVIAASGDSFDLYSDSTGTKVTGNGNMIVDEQPGFSFSQSGDVISVIEDASTIATFTGTDNGIAVNYGSALHISDDYIALNYGSLGTVVTGNGDTIAVGGFDSIINSNADGIYIYTDIHVYVAGVKGTGNALAVDSDATIFAGDMGINIAGAYRESFVYLYGAGGDTINISAAGDRLHDHSTASDTINISSGGYDRIYQYTLGDTINLGVKDTALYLYGIGLGTVNVDSGLYTTVEDHSGLASTINVGKGTEAYIYNGAGDTVNISGGSSVKLYGGYGGTVFVSGAGNSLYDDSDGNTVTVGAGAGLYIYGYTSKFDTIVVSGSGSTIDTAYGDTINFVGGSGSTIQGYGYNTFVVSGAGNSITDESLYGSTIDVGAFSSVTLGGATMDLDTVVVSGIGSTITTGTTYIEFTDGSGSTLEGSGKDTLVVLGSGVTIVDGSTNTDAVEVGNGDGVSLTAYHDTITAQAGAQNVAVNLAGGAELTTLNANSDSSVGIGAGNTSGIQFINATGDTISISANNTTVYVYDSAFTAGHSSDTFDVTGTGDTVKFVNAIISAAAAFGPGNPGFPTIEDSYTGATAISLVSHP